MPFGILDGFLGEIFLKLFFILGKSLLKRNLIITLTLTIKSNFILSNLNIILFYPI